MKPVTGEDNQRQEHKMRPPEEAMKCPRCDSLNTKFCYYNNYSLTQPRYFCKTCRRYWTKGGALRNVPIGGGCRKNKIRTTKSSSSTSDSNNSSSHFGGLKHFQRFSPAIDGGGLPFSRFPSSIESLSYLNQDLHCKLQNYQRLAMDFGEEMDKDGGGGGGVSVSALPVSDVLEYQISQAQKPPQPISFQDVGISKQEVSAVNNNPTNLKNCMSAAVTTEWFFENSSYTPTTTTTTTTTTNNNNNSGSNDNNNTTNWNGIQAWTDLHQYAPLP